MTDKQSSHTKSKMSYINASREENTQLNILKSKQTKYKGKKGKEWRKI